MRHSVFGFVIVAAASGSAVQALPFDITITFDTPLGAERESAFNDAATFWESVITGYQSPAFDTIGSLRIDAAIAEIDNSRRVLATAGPRRGVSDGVNKLPATGAITLDRADLDRIETNGTFSSVVLHEMAHVIGFGSLWEVNGLYTPGSGQYTGRYGLQAYRDTCDASATYIPVEIDGGGTAANTHWDEATGGTGNGPLCPDNPEAFRELMTGWLNEGPFVSPVTIASFADLGYTTTYTHPIAAVPLPATGLLMLGGLLGVGMARRRKPVATSARSSVDTPVARS